MLYYDRIDVTDGTDANKTNARDLKLKCKKCKKLKECILCHYWYLLDKEFKFQQDVCNGCHDVLMMYMNLSDIAILNIQGVNYRCILNELAKMRP